MGRPLDRKVWYMQWVKRRTLTSRESLYITSVTLPHAVERRLRFKGMWTC